MHDKSPRGVRSKKILSELGFDVRFLFAGNSTGSKIVSLKMAHFEIYERIVAEEIGPWCYVFEDDIALARKSPDNSSGKMDFSIEHDLISLESLNPYYIYLGICAPKRVSQNDTYCGRCTHAYGISREGAKLLLDYALHRPNKVIDRVVEKWCLKQGGFPVSNIHLVSYQSGDHFGSFIQDRQAFKSLLKAKS